MGRPKKVVAAPKLPEELIHGLCFRCDHRARFMEYTAANPDKTDAPRPRAECGDPMGSKSSCYMYKPVRPLMLKPETGDNRPVFGPAAIAARMRVVGFPEDMQVVYRGTNATGMTPYWRPIVGYYDKDVQSNGDKAEPKLMEVQAPDERPVHKAPNPPPKAKRMRNVQTPQKGVDGQKDDKGPKVRRKRRTANKGE